MWNRESEVHIELSRDAVPTVEAGLNLADIIVTKTRVESRQSRNAPRYDPLFLHFLNWIEVVREFVIVGQFALFKPPFESGGEVCRRIGRHFRTVQVQRHGVMEVEEFLNGLKIDHAQCAHLSGIRDLMFAHRFTGPLYDSGDARFADEEMMRLLCQHETARPRQRIETRFRKRGQLELTIAIGEEREHEERQPVASLLIERSQDTGIVLGSRAPF